MDARCMYVLNMYEKKGAGKKRKKKRKKEKRKAAGCFCLVPLPSPPIQGDSLTENCFVRDVACMQTYLHTYTYILALTTIAPNAQVFSSNLSGGLSAYIPSNQLIAN